MKEYLDSEQQEAVDCDHSQLVIAGPGSGKTRVLTEKASKLFNSGQNILCLTFTRAAAREMGERVPMIPATTIHSYCCGNVGWNDKWGYTGLLYRFLKEEDKTEFDWVLVDEVQDLNELELDVVLSLSQKNLFAVGDPYQSIYGFQGALGPRVVEILNLFGCETFNLRNNYRSCQKIVDRLNGIFNRDLVSANVKDVGMDCILCRTNDDLVYVSKSLEEAKVPHRLRLSTVYTTAGRERDILGQNKLMTCTIHSSKGLEFDRVYIFDWLPNEAGEEERVYYTAIARASKELKEIRSITELLRVLERTTGNLCRLLT